MRSTGWEAGATRCARSAARSHANFALFAITLSSFRAVVSSAKRVPKRSRRGAAIAEAAALAERRRVAQDLHDGIAQDLALIAAYEEQITAAIGPEHPVVIAARRALSVTRATIAELSDPPGLTTAEMLSTLAGELSERFGISVNMITIADLELGPEERHHLSRILREAVTNAVRHGSAKNVTVALTRVSAKIRLLVSDDGQSALAGDLASPAAGHLGSKTIEEGFGLRSMRERAAELGGSLEMRRSASGWTELELTIQ